MSVDRGAGVVGRSPAEPPSACTRRDLMRTGVGCGGWLLLALAASPATVRRAFARRQFGEVVAEEAFGRLEVLGDGVWGLVSTPFEDDWSTLSNGGIIAGSAGVLVVEGFNTPEGAAWMAARAAELTGRPPTHVVVTHYHGDHTRGLGGFAGASSPELMSTPGTLDLLQNQGQAILPDPVIPEAGTPTEIDLGGRTVRIAPRAGHTPSDVTIEIDEPRVVFCGDLVWNGLFPNYMDAIPTRLSAHCEALLADPGATYVPGHGDIADQAGLRPFLGLIADVERAARAAIDAGTPAATAAQRYAVPESLGEWRRFSDRYFRVAFEAWERELSAEES